MYGWDCAVDETAAVFAPAGADLLATTLAMVTAFLPMVVFISDFYRVGQSKDGDVER